MTRLPRPLLPLLAALAWSGCATPTLQEVARHDLPRISIAAPVPVPDDFEFDTAATDPVPAGTRSRFEQPAAAIQAQLPAAVLRHVTRGLSALGCFELSAQPLREQFRVHLSSYSIEPLPGGRFTTAVWMDASVVDGDEDSYWYSEATARSRVTFNAAEVNARPQVLLASLDDALATATHQLLHPPAAPHRSPPAPRPTGSSKR